MAHESLNVREKIHQINDNLSIWKVHIDALREQDKNARAQSPEVFKQLAANIKGDAALESLPLTVIEKNAAQNEEFHIISGHHRTRAARAAGLTEVYVLAYEGLSRSAVVAKQLSHNKLQGEDNPQIIKEIFNQIEEIEQRIASGIGDKDLLEKAKKVSNEDIQVMLNFEMVQLMFMPHQMEKFEQMVELIDKDASVGVVEMKSFNKFKKAVSKIIKEEDIRNVSSVVTRMVEITLDFYREKNGIDGSHKEKE